MAKDKDLFSDFVDYLNEEGIYNFDFEEFLEESLECDDDDDDDEVEESMKNMDIFLSYISKTIRDFETNNNLMLNPKRMCDFSKVYETIKLLVKDDKKATVTQKINEPYLTMGCITVISPNIIIKNPQTFVKLINIADTFEVFPLTNGKTQMNFGFNDMVIPLDKTKDK